MDKYNNYDSGFFLADDAFVAWVRSGQPIEGTSWEKWIQSDPAVINEFHQARKIVLEWSNTPSQLSDEKRSDQIAKIMVGVSDKNQTKVLPFKYGFWIKIASMLVLAIGLGWLGLRQSQKSNAYTYEKMTLYSENKLAEIVNNKNADYEVLLPDGSKVTLSKGSRLSYSQNFTKDPTRNVYLKGDGFFQVTKDKKRPLLVYTNGLVTRVVGTSFKISSIGTKISVAVRSGKVAVYSMTEAENPKSERLFLIPNQEAVFAAEKNEISKKLVENPIVLQGQKEALKFDYVESPVSTIFNSLEKAYGIKIQYDQELLEHCNITTPLRDEPFFTKLDIVCRTIQATYQIADDKVIIFSKGCN